MTSVLIVLIFTATFLLAAMAVFVAAFVQQQFAARRAAFETAAPESTSSLLRDEEALTSIDLWQPLLRRLDLVESLRELLHRSGVRSTVGRMLAAMLLLGGIACGLAFQFEWLPPGSPLIAFAVGAWLPVAWLKRRRNKRMRRIEEQFPDALESLARMMRAGHPLSSALELLAADVPAPLGRELRRIADEHRFGAPLEAVLAQFSERVPLDEVRLFASAANLQSKAGGRMTDVLERLAETIREGVALRGEVRAISAHGRLTGLVLTVLPAGIAMMLYFTSPGYLEVLFHHPSGKYLIWTALACLFLGHFAIQRIVKVRAS